MSSPMTPAQWKKQLEKFNVPVEYYDGWENRGRPPSKGPFSDVHGIVIHHTGGDLYTGPAYSKFLFVTGRKDLPAPLCHAEGRANGTIVMGAAKRANHAGLGNSKSLEHCINETTPYDKELKPSRRDNGVDGNRNFYGIEIDYGGSAVGPTSAQWVSAVNWAAAICDFHGWTGASVIGHREWTYTKPDPARILMYRFREQVNERIRQVNEHLTPEPEEPEVPTDLEVPADLLPLTIAKLTLPVGPSEHPTEIKQPQLNTYEHPKYFYLDEYLDRPLVMFEAPPKGTSTSGSDYTRTEIREMKPGGKNPASWNNGVPHRCHYVGVVFVKHKVVPLQVHDANDDLLLITVQNKTVKVEFSKGKGLGSVPYLLDDKYVPGTPIYITIKTGIIQDGKKGIRVRYRRGGSPSSVEIFREVKSRNGCYWKYGVYNQVKSGPNGKVGVFKVEIS